MQDTSQVIQSAKSAQPQTGIRVAALLTCHNRCAQTLRCLYSLVEAVEHHNAKCEHARNLSVEVYLTDDGCTDNTVAMSKSALMGKMLLHIVRGDGNLFWSNGMNAAWREAMKGQWDFFLLLNDDTELFTCVFDELFLAHDYSLKRRSRIGICSGITCAPSCKADITYGGYRWTNRFLGRKAIVLPTGEPQLCDMANANILLVDKSVVDKVGIFYGGYKHGAADFDYSVMVRKSGMDVMVTANVCGTCPYDHNSEMETIEKLCRMTYKQRKAYFSSPLHSIHDYLVYTWRCTPERFLLVLCGRYVSLWCPQLYKVADAVRRRLHGKQCGN